MAKEKNDFPEFFYSHRYEAKVYQKIGIAYMQERLQQDEVKIAYLIGQRGRIEEQEYKNV